MANSFTCSDCGVTVTRPDNVSDEDWEMAVAFTYCARCYYNPDKWGNE